ncbi:hypothetical protein [Microseira sp. BLCC-F43]|jgi:hypothetical protein|uniref:hypothetical protein n=1 Tax=Microseira sp. BLCC-F43 TaxID=3153602 RepID=UPI0035B6E092
MNPDVSNYAKGRYRLWLFHECNLKTGEITKAYYDSRIYQFSQRVFPGCNIGLLTFGGKHNGFTSHGKILPHRDHSYAMPIAKNVNLGKAIFGYGDRDHKQYELSDGDIVEFNCKVFHSVPKILSQEISIVFWKLNEAKGYFPKR